ncbi:hypothetical protein O7623_16205 [Solwaraspora sp. WMMD791]|uniref:hypothetical protein n=1 Tax=Solwaraspora sp. WMMD791 TaxID=3016086 RepID=UPI00249BCB05|nr:hypothetical protein [Solwaraspora sp. WMMD791]WFE24971.1 hypothetical protein O7623_16205 [Solwaraspora sp. WMMD791]
MTRSATAAQDTGPGPDVPDESPRRGSRRSRIAAAARRHAPDIAVSLFFVAVSAWLTYHLWPSPGGRLLALNPEDQTLYEWFLASDARLLLGDFSLLSDRLNAPDGVNLMTNTTVIALGFLMAPVTLAFGAPVTFALLVAGNLAASAIAFYLMFVRLVGAHRFAAAVGGAFCGFAPGMVSQSNSHLHMTAIWLIPVMVWLLARLMQAADPTGSTPNGRITGPAGRADRRRTVTSGAWLGVVVAVQVFVGEEVLFLTAVTLIVMAAAFAAAAPRYVRRILPTFVVGMAVAVAVGVVLLAYPLWFQFAGPQGVSDGVFDPDYFSADLASWPAVSELSVAGSASAADLTTGPAEYNTFLGWPLLIVTAGCAGWLIRRPMVVACTVGTVLMAGLSLGPRVVVDGTRTDVPGPYALLNGLPVVDGALPMRFALAVIPLIATILVLAIDRALRLGWRPGRVLVPAVLTAALLPVVPAPLPGMDREPLPEFITAGHWRECVSTGGVLVPVPPATPKEPWPMAWATAANVAFGMPEGFFIGPYAPGGEASMGTFKQPTSKIWAEVARTGEVPEITDDERARARRDLARWGADCVVVADGTVHADPLRRTTEELIGPGERIADAWVWRVG